MAQEGPQGLLDRLISDAVLLASVTFLGYLVAFYYTKGRFEYFSLPSTLIELNLTSVLAIITGVWVTVYLILNGSFVFLQGFWQWSLLRRKLVFFVLLTLYFVIHCLLMQCARAEWITAGAVIAFLLAWEFLWPPIFSYPGTYSEKLEQSERVESVITDLTGVLSARFGAPVVVVIVLLLLVLPLVRAAGYSSAANQVRFPIYLGNNESCAVVNFQEARLVCLAFDEHTSQLTGRFLLIPISGPLLFEDRKIGPLRGAAQR